jgi:hypothetical protein
LMIRIVHRLAQPNQPPLETSASQRMILGFIV